MEKIGASVLPVVIGVILIYGFFKGVEVFDAFITGAKEGVSASLKVLPTLIGLIMAVTMLRSSGLLDMLCGLIEPLAELVGVSPEIAPLALLRPVSGSGASAYTMSLLETFGPDSETGKIASVLSSATETTFYAVAVYFGATKCKKLYYTIPVSLMGDLATLIFAVITVKVL